MKRTWKILGIAGLALGVVASGLSVSLQKPAEAHHAFASEFDINKPILLRGNVKQLDWINPHAWIHIDVKNPNGKSESWAIEFGGTTALMRRGLRKDSFPVGSDVVVQAYLAKNGKKVANATKVTLPDGTGFFTGSSAPGAQ